MTTFKATHDSLSRLADRVVTGEVVFFVGAGASRDSEGNTGDVLVARLLARFEALSWYLHNHTNKPISHRADAIYANLSQTFPITAAPTYLTPANVSTLARDYYLINDWMCSALGELLDLVADLGEPEDMQNKLVEDVRAREQRLFVDWKAAAQKEWRLVPWPGDTFLVAPGPGEMDLQGLLTLDSSFRGKALFLDTMGFTERAVMGGAPSFADPQKVMTSMCGGLPESERLLERHHVLARFAREGLCQTLITTNYDLLLESAYRLAGFDTLPIPLNHESDLPPTTFAYFDRVASANQFFQRGVVARAPRLVKIHGCAEVYRWLRKPKTGDRATSWQAYLPAVVFTYREIQNWRQDAWSRDFLRTLLRTRTVVFCGYSLQDPVLHDTFRTVYEEMAAHRVNVEIAVDQLGGAFAEPPGGRAPAFFFGLQDRREFHGTQILRAASQAVGDAEDLPADHPNYIGFFPRQVNPEFPTLDELMVWLFHLVMRRRQQHVLESDLTRIATLLLEHAVPAHEVSDIRKRHETLRKAEVRQARQWRKDRRSRQAFARASGWTRYFQVGLLRELAIAEDALRNPGPERAPRNLRWSWYFPTVDHPDWTAWAAVVEIAVRRMIAAWRDEPGSWLDDSEWVRPALTDVPGVEFATNCDYPTPRLLTLVAAPEDEFSAPRVPGAFSARALWKMQPASIPWLRPSAVPPTTPRANHLPHGLTPTADVIWSWAWRRDTRPLVRGGDAWASLSTALGDPRG